MNGDLDALARVRRRVRRDRSIPLTSSVWFRHSRSSLIDRVELPARQRRRRQPRVDPRDRLLTRAPRDGREDLVGLQCVEDRLVARVDLGVAGNPGAHRVPAFDVGRERVERLGRRAHLAGDLPRQLPEHVFLAGEVLVEGDPRAPGELRDPVDAAAVVALVAEGAQRGVEDALLRALPAGPDLRVVGERRAPDDRDGAVGATISLVVGHHGLLGQVTKR